MNRNDVLNGLRHLKRSSFLRAKRLSELLYRDKVWLDCASDPNRVRDLIRELRVHKTGKPLIRIGAHGDGGYLVPDDLNGVVACISPGVSTEVSFDLAMAERGIPVVMADASVAGPPLQHPLFKFHKKFLGVANSESFIRLDDLVASYGTGGDMILQMDIEGAEYPVLLDVSEETLRRFRVIVLEIHDLQKVFGSSFLAVAEALVAKLKRSHVVVHIHPNNACGAVSRAGVEIPMVLEFTLYRKDRDVEDRPATINYPHPLDVDNVAHRKPLNLARIWR